MVLRKVVAFIGLLGVIYALALQHGLFDRADAASPAALPASGRAGTARGQAEVKSATKRLHSRH